jgi:nucleoside-diphosphate-sugar epimerase
MFRALYGLPVVLLRPFMTYGPGQGREKLIPYVVASLHAGKAPELGSGTRMVDWVYVDDVIDAFLLAAERDVSGRTIDLGWGRMVAIRSVVELIHEKMGGPAPRFGAITDRKMEMERAANTTYARAHLGWTARTPLSTGLDKTIAAYTQGDANAIGKEGHAHAGCRV